RTPRELADEDRPRQDRPGRSQPSRPVSRGRRDEAVPDDAAPKRRIHFDDGREPAEFTQKHYGKKPRTEKPEGRGAAAGERPARPGRPPGDGAPPARRPAGESRPQRGLRDRPA